MNGVTDVNLVIKAISMAGTQTLKEITEKAAASLKGKVCRITSKQVQMSHLFGLTKQPVNLRYMCQKDRLFENFLKILFDFSKLIFSIT